MTLSQTYSWLFYALALASGNGPAKYKDIEQAADGINHAIPTQKEIRKSLAWLSDKGLVIKEGKTYFLSGDGNTLLNRLTSKAHTTMGVWENIERYFEECGVDNVANINPNTLAT
jgi:predicted transcriptional regulator